MRINRIKITNYRFFRDEFALDIGGANLLIYGENGSGKSAIYRALEYLTKRSFNSIAEEKNIFSEAGEPLIEFGFTNGKELTIHSDLTELPAGNGRFGETERDNETGNYFTHSRINYRHFLEN